MSDTPRTDAEAFRLEGWGEERLVMADFARQLEREVAELRKESTVLNSLDWNRLREGDRRALNPDNQLLFDEFYSLREATIEECAKAAENVPTVLEPQGTVFSERVAAAIRALKASKPSSP